VGVLTEHDHRSFSSRAAKRLPMADGDSEAVSTAFRDLIDEGVRHARALSDALNARALTTAALAATATGTVQTPKQVMIGQNLYRCAECSPGGSPIMILNLPAVAAVLPPER
jgi:hypothetical protein